MTEKGGLFLFKLTLGTEFLYSPTPFLVLKKSCNGIENFTNYRKLLLARQLSLGKKQFKNRP